MLSASPRQRWFGPTIEFDPTTFGLLPCGPSNNITRLPVFPPCPPCTIFRRSKLPNLVVLRLHENQIGDEGMRSLVAALRRGAMPSLVRLDLSSNLVRDDGAVALGGLLTTSSHGTLEEVQLAANLIGDRGCRALLDSAAFSEHSYPNLTSLDLRANHIDLRAVAALIRASPRAARLTAWSIREQTCEADGDDKEGSANAGGETDVSGPHSAGADDERLVRQMRDLEPLIAKHRAEAELHRAKLEVEREQQEVAARNHFREIGRRAAEEAAAVAMQAAAEAAEREAFLARERQEEARRLLEEAERMQQALATRTIAEAAEAEAAALQMEAARCEKQLRQAALKVHAARQRERAGSRRRQQDEQRQRAVEAQRAAEESMQEAAKQRAQAVADDRKRRGEEQRLKRLDRQARCRSALEATAALRAAKKNEGLAQLSTSCGAGGRGARNGAQPASAANSAVDVAASSTVVVDIAGEASTPRGMQARVRTELSQRRKLMHTCGSRMRSQQRLTDSVASLKGQRQPRRCSPPMVHMTERVMHKGASCSKSFTCDVTPSDCTRETRGALLGSAAERGHGVDGSHRRGHSKSGATGTLTGGDARCDATSDTHDATLEALVQDKPDGSQTALSDASGHLTLPTTNQPPHSKTRRVRFLGESQVGATFPTRDAPRRAKPGSTKAASRSTVTCTMTQRLLSRSRGRLATVDVRVAPMPVF